MDRLLDFLQIQQSLVSRKEILVSICGGFIGIFLVILLSSFFVDPHGVALIVASMGASAVLLFAVPHGTLSQPWPLLGSHIISAIIGVSCARLISSPLVAAAAAVSLSIGAMHVLRCIHPPGGATALTAVMGGDAIHVMGFQFVITPVLLNVFIILIIGVLFSYPFEWRRYPVSWVRVKSTLQVEPNHPHEDVIKALRDMDTFIDVTEEDLLRIYDLIKKAEQQHGASVIKS